MTQKNTHKRIATIWKAMPIATVIVLAGFGGSASADDEPQPDQANLPDVAVAIPRMPSPLPKVETHAYLTGWIGGGACAGTVTIFDKEPENALLALLDGLTAQTGQNQTITAPNQPHIEPALVIAILGLAVAILATAIALASLHAQQAEAMKDPYAEWEYHCDALGFGLEANGDGGALRRVTVQAPAGGQPTDVGSPCEYDGVVTSTCATPATYRNDAAQPAGGEKGTVDVVMRNGRWEFDPALPVSANVCIDPGARAMNGFQVPLLNQVMPPSYGVLDGALCTSACIIWADNVGCLAPDE